MPPRTHVEAALAAEEERAFALATRVRLVVLLVVGVWLGVEQPADAVVFLWAFVGAFLLLGIVPLWLRRRGRWGGWWPWIFPALDAALLGIAVLVPNPLDSVEHPIAQRLRFGNEVYFFLLIAFATFTFSPRLVLWQGVVSAIVWVAGGLVALATGDSYTILDPAIWRAMTPAEVVQHVADPDFIPFPVVARPAVLFVVVAGALATIVWRARRLVAHQAHAERARTNLARYFSANLVDQLAATDEPLGASRSQDCAVLFADVVGFTRLAAAAPPEEVIAFLRDYHARMEHAVFAHGGTLDKYVGDGLMATFGTPTPGPDDAVRALRCAWAMLDGVATWNQERAAMKRAPVRIGVGVHYGPVTLGDIGGPHRFEFAVLGDTVNVASRLERLTREIGAPIVVSDAVIAAARAQAPGDPVTAGFTRAAARALRGRDAPVVVWTAGAVDPVTTTGAGRA